MTGPGCALTCNLINTPTSTPTHIPSSYPGVELFTFRRPEQHSLGCLQTAPTVQLSAAIGKMFQCSACSALPKQSLSDKLGEILTFPDGFGGKIYLCIHPFVDPSVTCLTDDLDMTSCCRELLYTQGSLARCSFIKTGATCEAFALAPFVFMANN